MRAKARPSSPSSRIDGVPSYTAMAGSGRGQLDTVREVEHVGVVQRTRRAELAGRDQLAGDCALRRLAQEGGTVHRQRAGGGDGERRLVGKVVDERSRRGSRGPQLAGGFGIPLGVAGDLACRRREARSSQGCSRGVVTRVQREVPRRELRTVVEANGQQVQQSFVRQQVLIEPLILPVDIVDISAFGRHGGAGKENAAVIGHLELPVTQIPSESAGVFLEVTVKHYSLLQEITESTAFPKVAVSVEFTGVTTCLRPSRRRNAERPTSPFGTLIRSGCSSTTSPFGIPTTYPEVLNQTGTGAESSENGFSGRCSGGTMTLERRTARQEETRRSSKREGSFPARNQTPRSSPTNTPSPLDSNNEMRPLNGMKLCAGLCR